MRSTVMYVQVPPLPVCSRYSCNCTRMFSPYFHVKLQCLLCLYLVLVDTKSNVKLYRFPSASAYIPFADPVLMLMHSVLAM